MALDLIIVYFLLSVAGLAITLGVIYGLMLYVRLIICTVKEWRAEDGK